MSALISVEEAEFTWLQEQTGATAGNLSVQIAKLKEAGYIEVRKQFRGNYPQTRCWVSPKGIRKFEAYMEALRGYLNLE